MNHYYISNLSADKGFAEISESDFFAIVGTEETRPYAVKVYRGETTIEEVPEDLREAVRKVVDAKTARWGEYQKRVISDSEALSIILGGEA